MSLCKQASVRHTARLLRRHLKSHFGDARHVWETLAFIIWGKEKQKKNTSLQQLFQSSLSQQQEVWWHLKLKPKPVPPLHPTPPTLMSIIGSWFCGNEKVGPAQ